MTEFFVDIFISAAVLSVIIFTVMITLCFVAKMFEEIVMVFRRIFGKKAHENKGANGKE